MTTNKCPNCLEDVGDSYVVLNIFNISNPEYRERTLYCSGECVKNKVNSVISGDGQYFPFILPKKDILYFAQAKNGEFSVIVDL
jgi:hypothetical protein